MDIKVASGISKDGKSYDYLYVDVKINGQDVPVRVQVSDFSLRQVLINAVRSEKK